MTFEPRVAEARLALNLISSTEMPKLAWDAIEAGLDGPAIRRLASFEFPTFFQVQEVLPRAMEEMRLARLDKTAAAVQLTKLRAQEILARNLDPLKYLRDFEQVWIASDYCRELRDYGNLDDDVHVARCMGQTEQEIRTWLTERLKQIG
jgi:anaerobic glycerol-3-phosphate dehydrogenase